LLANLSLATVNPAALPVTVPTPSALIEVLPMHPVETYLRELRDTRSTGAGVKETSYYTPLANLLNAIGQTLKPRVRCIMTLKNLGAGYPDGGLFTPDQIQRAAEGEPLPGQKPSRGAIEVKSTAEDAWVTAETEQVSRYWREYRQVLVTNYRDFVFVGQDADGRPVKLETYRRPRARRPSGAPPGSRISSRKRTASASSSTSSGSCSTRPRSPTPRTWPGSWSPTPATPRPAWPPPTSRRSTRSAPRSSRPSA
jgi:hypothetical protein